MKTYRLLIYAIATSAVLATGCERQIRTDAAKPAVPATEATPTTEPIFQDVPSSTPISNPPILSPPFDRNTAAPRPVSTLQNPEEAKPIDTLSRNIRSFRNSKETEQGDKLMQNFVNTWKPVGKRLSELERHLGKPDEKTGGGVSYRFDTGYGGWEWRFKTAGELITGVQREGIN